ncbi:putative chemoreceptor glutamine deamidase CheD 3 [Desulfuromonas versatilis]|uniref:Probable chemoreceptor glutamine deamidase CheD n=1 Tax=Desulfuromonas versatilis TaxID=2802975 RepID=A0ABM8I215_9BACT|nr:chemotaxis protein CheD [Desulfuromonas versatilis]BCR06860.1 putative chemoreceptor glutamine deamidase CheD 3 [Desulfuromonas versatilis]
MTPQLRVGISELQVAQAPAELATFGLGSCLGIVLYDPGQKVGGLAHTLLPAPRQGREEARPSKFVSTAIGLMLEQLEELGAARERIWAKIIGGANMFESLHPSPEEGIGARNARCARELLAALGVPLLAEDVGGNYGRTVFFDLASGQVLVRSVRGGEKIITL